MTLQERLSANPDEYVNYATENGEVLSLPVALVESWTPSQRNWVNSRLDANHTTDLLVERALRVYKQRQADLKWQDRLERWLDEKADQWAYNAQYGSWKDRSHLRAVLWFNSLRLVCNTGLYRRLVRGKF